MTTKAQNLCSVKETLKAAKVLDLAFFSYKDWIDSPDTCIQKVRSTLKGTTNFIVRSSALSEDQTAQSNAGKYESILNVSGNALSEAIQKVVNSFGKAPCSADEILVQPMLENVAMSGVLFTKDPNTTAEYYVINYELNGDTTAVTSGSETLTYTRIIARTTTSPLDSHFQLLIDLADELEEKTDHTALDIEFAFDTSNQLYLFQFRPLACAQCIEKIDQKETLSKISEKINMLMTAPPHLLGEKTVFGIMPDWNPAEIIGVRPRQLALSLYKEMITDSTWAYQRDNYGYRNLRSFPLLVHFHGLPYIDVRVSFNSFIPQEVPSELGAKLVDYYVQRLINEPQNHDKVEFDIVYSCYTFDLPERIKALSNYGFSKIEQDTLLKHLKSLTHNIIHVNTGLWKKDLDKINILKNCQERLLSSPLDSLGKIYWLIEDCKRYGTLPFAGLARAGFIANQILNSLVEINSITQEERHDFLNTLQTVSSDLNSDLNKMPKEGFLKKYGHLRPGTYDILAYRYDERPDIYFSEDLPKASLSKNLKDFKINFKKMKAINALLAEHELDHDVIELFDFITAGIEGREYAKFIFTKSLSDAISLLQKLGEEYGFTRDDMSYVDISVVHELYSSCQDVLDILSNSIKKGKEMYKKTAYINLPPLITNTDDVWNFEIPSSQPNYITHKKVIANVETQINKSENLTGKIIAIPSADPGFDWIFTHNIAGFITAYGGANSHMAIRACELGLPAVIGAGEILYNKWAKASKIEIDCANRKVEIFS